MTFQIRRRLPSKMPITMTLMKILKAAATRLAPVPFPGSLGGRCDLRNVFHGEQGSSQHRASSRTHFEGAFKAFEQPRTAALDSSEALVISSRQHPCGPKKNRDGFSARVR